MAMLQMALQYLSCCSLNVPKQEAVTALMLPVQNGYAATASASSAVKPGGKSSDSVSRWLNTVMTVSALQLPSTCSTHNDHMLI